MARTDPSTRPGLSPHSQQSGRARAGSASFIGAEPARTVELVGDRRLSLAPGRADRQIASIAAAQNCCVSRAQLRAAGVDRRAIDRRLRNGRLVRRHYGVYIVAGGAPGELQEETAALLAIGPGAVLSHHSAATLWRLRPGAARPIHVTVADGAHGPQPSGVIVHRTTTLRARDVQVKRELPLTSPARTVLDLAAKFPDRDLAYVMEDGFARRLLTEDALSDVLNRAGGHPGAHTLARVLHAERPGLTESAAQRRLLKLIHEAGLPPPKTECSLLSYRVDMLWIDIRLVVEVDGYPSHSSRWAFERDRRRDARLHAAGFAVIRITAREIEHEPLAVIARLAQAIVARTRELTR